jgi:hypothetical protein
MTGFLPALAAAVAFVNVSVIPMDRERIEAGQTVVVEDGRIAAIGPTGRVAIPERATIVDGAGKYLVPGLTDAHVHLPSTPWAPTKPAFGDAPRYLASGITTVVNLGGTPEQLEWRRRIEVGDLIAPTIYTAGAFVNEPRVSTPEEVEREIFAQSQDGYDLIKYHELDDTTTGLSLAAYQKMNQTARAMGLPIVGHAPVNLGLEAMLEARQPLAHVGMLSNIYFMPMLASLRWLALTAVSFLSIIVLVAACTLPRVWALARGVALSAFLALVGVVLYLPGGPFFASIALRVAVSALSAIAALAALLMVRETVALWRDTKAALDARVLVSLATVTAVSLAAALTIFWVPVSWRSTPAAIDRLSARIHDAGISVQSTLVVYETVSSRSRYPAFLKTVVASLHRAGVPIIAGTDANGIPNHPPGASLHRELQLLVECGFTPFEALRAATVAPAVFLRKDREFGTIATGNRADLLLIDGNPLEDLRRLEHPAAVMARGKLLTPEQLQE